MIREDSPCVKTPMDVEIGKSFVKALLTHGTVDFRSNVYDDRLSCVLRKEIFIITGRNINSIGSN